MARPVKRRRICELPQVRQFAPAGAENTEPVAMTLDEYETIRLIDHLGFSQEECAAQMNVARTTVQAIYDTARKKLALSLVEARRLEIGGGTVEVCPRAAECCGKNCCNRHGNGGCGGCHGAACSCGCEKVAAKQAEKQE